MKRLLFTAGVTGALLMLAACETTNSTTQPTSRAMSEASYGMLNDTCPMSGEKVDPSAKTASYAGHTVGFCCDMCVGGWNKKSASEKAAYVASQSR